VFVPFLIDGNNLIHALRQAGIEVGRVGLRRLLGRLSSDGEKVQIVFDGPPPAELPGGQGDDRGLEVAYSAPRSADELIVEHIADNTAPRRLTVVTSDREILRAARRRRCRLATSQDFIEFLLRALLRGAKPRPVEPPEKRKGLTAEQARRWLRELGLDEARPQTGEPHDPTDKRTSSP